MAALALAHRDSLWLIPCTLALWMAGLILGFDDRGVFQGSEQLAPTWAAWGLVVGVLGIWQWRRFLIRDDFTRPTHDSSDDLLWLLGISGCLAFYVAIVPASRLLPPNGTVCVLAGLAGLRLLYSGLTRRIGATLHCSYCNYEISDTSLPRSCPECARPWASRLTRGRIEPSLKLIGAGVVLLFVLTLSPLPRVGFAKAFIYRQMSTAWILTQAQNSLTNQTSIDPRLWGELSRRTLTPAESTPIAELVLRRNTEHNLPDYNPMGWLIELVLSGQASGPISDSLLTEALHFQLVAPTETVAGRPFPLRVTGYDSLRLPRNRIGVFLEPIFAENDTLPATSSSSWELLSSAMDAVEPIVPPAPVVRTPQAQAALPPQPPAPVSVAKSDVLGLIGRIRIAEPGKVRYVGRIWVAVLPSGSLPNLAPQSLSTDGATPGNTAPPFLKAFEIETTVTAIPAVRQR
ncbi:MAG: hypothetical protein U0573_09125 [Phycisphaerales bacterium]